MIFDIDTKGRGTYQHGSQYSCCIDTSDKCDDILEFPFPHNIRPVTSVVDRLDARLFQHFTHREASFHFKVITLDLG